MDKVITIGAGQIIFKQGDKGGDLYFINEGEVDLLVRDEETGREAVVATLGPKSVMGTMSFLEGDPRSATAKAKSEIKCIKISQVQRDRMLTSVPSWFRILIKDLSQNLRRINTLYIKMTADMTLLQKKLGVRDKQKVRQEEDFNLELGRTKEELAEWKKAAGKFKKEGAALRQEVDSLKAQLAAKK